MPLIANSLRTLSAALITTAIVVAALVLGREILVPLALAGISCFVLVPPVRWLRQRSVPKAAAVSVVVIATVGVLAAASYGLSTQLISLAAELPAYRTNVLAKVRSVVGGSVPSGVVGRAVDGVESYREMLDRELKLGFDSPATATAPPDADKKVEVVRDQSDSGAWYGLSILAAPLTQAALTFLFTLFLLMQYKDLRDRIVRVFGVDNMSETTAAMSDAGDRLTDLFTAQVILNAAFGLVVGCALLVLGVPNAPLWGVVAFAMRFVPFVGSYLAAIPPLLLAAAVDPGWTKAICVLALFGVGEPIMGQVLEPLVLGKRAGLSPFAMVLATSFWTLTWGPLGLVLAAPITTVLVVLGKYIPDLEFITVLLGDEPPLSAQQDLYHHFLSGDVYGAISQIEGAEETASKESVLDTVVFPVLNLAARDRRRGRFDADSAKELEETIAEVVGRSESEDPDDGEILFIPVRGPFDELAAKFAAAGVNAEKPGTAWTVGDASGLTALSSLSEFEAAKHVELAVFITAVGLSEKLIGLMAKKASGLLPGARVVFLDLASPVGSAPPNRSGTDRVQTFRLFSDLRASAGALTERADPAQSNSPLESNVLALAGEGH